MQCDAPVFQEETRNQCYRGWYCQQDKFFTWDKYFVTKIYLQRRLIVESVIYIYILYIIYIYYIYWLLPPINTYLTPDPNSDF